MKKSFDIQFHSDSNSNSKGFVETADYCIKTHNDGSGYSYFNDYVGGTVQVVNTESGEVIYEEVIK